MTKPLISYRRIDQLKAIALDRGFNNEDAKQFGKLSKTATWFALLEAYGISSQSVDSVDTALDNKLDTVDTADTVDREFNRLTQAIGRTMARSRSATLPARIPPIF